MIRQSVVIALTIVITKFALSQENTSEELDCLAGFGVYELVRIADGDVLGEFSSLDQCQQIRLSARGGVVCAWFTPGMPIGPGSWEETGWRPMAVATKMGLGRKAIADLETCLGVSRNASGGTVCTNTGLGYKPTNIETNMWCGASSQYQYCIQASLKAANFHVCSFPSSGTGAEAGWVRTKITSSCDYQSSQMSLENCSATIP